MNNSLNELRRLLHIITFRNYLNGKDIDYVNGVILFYNLKTVFTNTRESLVKVIELLSEELKNADSVQT